MLEMGTSRLMSGEGKPPAASRPRSSALPRLYSQDVAQKTVGKGSNGKQKMSAFREETRW